MSPDLYTPTSNSLLSNFVIAMGHGVENYHNLKQLFTYPSIRRLFALDIPIQVSWTSKLQLYLLGFNKPQAITHVLFVYGKNVPFAQSGLIIRGEKLWLSI